MPEHVHAYDWRYKIIWEFFIKEYEVYIDKPGTILVWSGPTFLIKL